jgi:hypothetical protein
MPEVLVILALIILIMAGLFTYRSLLWFLTALRDDVAEQAIKVDVRFASLETAFRERDEELKNKIETTRDLIEEARKEDDKRYQDIVSFLHGLSKTIANLEHVQEQKWDAADQRQKQILDQIVALRGEISGKGHVLGEMFNEFSILKALCTESHSFLNKLSEQIAHLEDKQKKMEDAVSAGERRLTERSDVLLVETAEVGRGIGAVLHDVQVLRESAVISEEKLSDVQEWMQRRPAPPRLLPFEALQSGACSLQLVGDDGTALAMIQTSVITPYKGNVAVPAKMARYLGPLIERLPTLFENGHQIANETYKVVLKPEFLQGIKDGSLTMMRSREVMDGFRLNVVIAEPSAWGDKVGQIVGQGSNVPISNVLQFATAGFQIATYITGQIHLAQINKRLNALELIAKDILAHLENMQEGQLLGKMRYLREASERLRAGVPDDVEAATLIGQMETIDRESLEVLEAVRKEVDRREEAVRSAVVRTGWVDGGKAEGQRLLQLGEDYFGALRRYQMALWVLLSASEVRAMLPGTPNTERRRQMVSEILEESRGRQAETTTLLKEKIDKVGATFSRGATVVEARKTFGNRAIDSHDSMQKGWLEMRSVIRNGQKTEDQRTRLLSGDVELLVSRDASGHIGATIAAEAVSVELLN